MKTLASALAFAVATIATPALANDQVVAGATVYGPEGNQVGTITQVENGQTLLDTGTHQIPLAVDLNHLRGEETFFTFSCNVDIFRF